MYSTVHYHTFDPASVLKLAHPSVYTLLHWTLPWGNNMQVNNFVKFEYTLYEGIKTVPRKVEQPAQTENGNHPGGQLASRYCIRFVSQTVLHKLKRLQDILYPRGWSPGGVSLGPSDDTIVQKVQILLLSHCQKYLSGKQPVSTIII